MKRIVLLTLLFLSILFSASTQVTQAGLNCCCGIWNQIFFPNFDFEDGPSPPVGGYIVYNAGSSFGGWTVTRANIDHVEATHANLGNGNPNGGSNFIDLHGSPGFGGISYKLTNLKPGAVYLLKFWTAQNGGNHSSTGTIKVAGGAWLNESWTVTISGAVAWFLMEFKFMAMADMAELEFSSVGDLSNAGTLIDDISLFECPPDIEFPIVGNEPIDEEYNCLTDVKRPPSLIVTDDCDLSPSVSFTEKLNKVSDCEQYITRDWIVSDDCNNSKKVTQQITVLDKEPPTLTSQGSDRIINCDKFSLTDFNLWLANHGGSKANDNCKTINWEYSFDKQPSGGCDTTLVTYIAKDLCGNETINYLNYIVRDTTRPSIIKTADSVSLKCSAQAKDSLRSWLIHHGNAEISDNCSQIFWKDNFNGDSNSLSIKVDFIAKDLCGNEIIIKGIFLQLDAPDTFYITSYVCELPSTRIDTSLFVLPGCDSVLIHKQIAISLDTTRVNKISCNPNQTPQELFVLKNQFQCDSTIIINYIFVPPDTTIVEKFICGISDTIINLTVLQGSVCDSLVFEKQIPAKQYQKQFYIKTCDSSQVGKDTFIFKTLYGCDSVVIQNVELGTILFTEQDSLVCGLVNSYRDTLKYRNQNCDSFHIIRYKGIPKDTTKISESTCDPSKVGQFYHTWTNSKNCDSVVIQTISLLPNYLLRNTQITCDKNQKPVDTVFLKSRYGCDSIIINTFTLKNIDTTFIHHTTCNKLLPSQEYLNLKGEYCDSVVSIQRSLLPGYVIRISLPTCHIDSVGIDSILLLSYKNCDSLVIQEKYYSPIDFTYKSSDISCFSYQDGKLELLSVIQGKNPVVMIVDGVPYPSTQIIDQLSKGTHFLYIIDSNNCYSDTVTIVINEPALVRPDIGPDLNINSNQIILLKELTGQNFKEYQWLPADLFDCNNCPESKLRVQSDTNVFLFVKDQNGCSASDTLSIRIRKSGGIFTPNTFSPNGDGVNDEFYLIGDDEIKVKYLSIYDRWGNLIFSHLNPRINKPDDGWNGIYKNKTLNPGVYVYQFLIQSEDGTEELRSGTITLVK
ncbi:MAG: gliding motility-associated C-terminal domain-containing protein [Saprospiraceae bacterium]|nr:gliding motility-associated C-terminal domain-containing protein [Saprospiraceae bacterium]